MTGLEKALQPSPPFTTHFSSSTGSCWSAWKDVDNFTYRAAKKEVSVIHILNLWKSLNHPEKYLSYLFFNQHIHEFSSLSGYMESRSSPSNIQHAILIHKCWSRSFLRQGTFAGKSWIHWDQCWRCYRSPLACRPPWGEPPSSNPLH